MGGKPGAKPSAAATQVKVVDKATGKLYGEVLTRKEFTTKASQDAFNALLLAAGKLRWEERTTKAGTGASTPPPAPPAQIADPNDAAAKQGVLKSLLAADSTCCSLFGCFAAGTKLWTPHGYRNIEDIRAGERVLSRDQWDAGGDVSARAVEEVFERYAGALRVHAGG